jgi:tetratricopeptide (TPR) repeat protein
MTIECAKVDYKIAQVRLLQARFKESEALLQKALQTYRRERGDVDDDVARVLNRLGVLYVDTNQLDLADRCLGEALRIRRELYGPKHSRVGQTLKNMTQLESARCDYVKALEFGVESLAIQEADFGRDDIRLMSALTALGRIHMAQNDFRAAQERFDRALAICVASVGDRHPKTAAVIYELGCFYFIKPEDLAADAEWSTDKAEEWLKRALSIYEETMGKSSIPRWRASRTASARSTSSARSFRARRPYFEEALDARLSTFGATHSRTAQTYKHLLTVHQLQEHYAEGARVRQEGAQGDRDQQRRPTRARRRRSGCASARSTTCSDGHTSADGRSALQTAHAKLRRAARQGAPRGQGARGDDGRRCRRRPRRRTPRAAPARRRAARRRRRRRGARRGEARRRAQGVHLSRSARCSACSARRTTARAMKKQKNLNAKMNWWKQGYNDAKGGDESDSDDDEVDEEPSSSSSSESDGKVAGAAPPAALNQSARPTTR